MKIYLKLDEEPKDVRELLSLLFSHRPTFTSTLTGVTTYYDKECKSIQCGAEKYRSIDDVIDICQSYFPKAKIKDIIKDLLTLRIICTYLNFDNTINTVTLYPWVAHCTTIQKNVVAFNKTPLKRSEASYSGYGKLNIKGKSKYTWRAVCRKIGIVNATLEKLKEYHDKNYYTIEYNENT